MTKSLGIVAAFVLGSTAIAGFSFPRHQTSGSPLPHPHSVPASQAKAASPRPGTAHADGSAKAKSLVRSWAHASLSGKALGIPQGDQQSYYALKHLWGAGTNATGINGITYFTYGAHHAVVGINEGVQLVDVRSYSPNLHQITLADIETVLGRPNAVRRAPQSLIYAYNRGQYQLLWVFSESASGKISATVNHVDVEWPKGMVAPMAQQNPPAAGRQIVHFTASGKNIRPGTSTLTIAKGGTVVFSPGNAATANLVKKNGVVLYGGEFGGIFPGRVPLSLADTVPGWSYKFSLPGTWRFAIVPSNTSAAAVPVTVIVKVTR